MPGDANAAECGWLRALVIGLVFTQMCVPASEAAGSQLQSQIPVTAYVVVSSTIAASGASIVPSARPTSSQPADQGASAQGGSQQGGNQPTKPPQAQQICTEVAVSCSGRAPMRLSVDDGDDDSSGDVQECSARAQNTVSLCSAGANGPQGSLGLNIEY